MGFTRPTLQQLVDRITSDFKARITGATALLRRSFVNTAARVYAGACHLLYGNLDYTKDQLFATTADSTNLDTHGSEIGVLRDEAQSATGSGIATGTNGKVIPRDTELQSGAGEIYLVDANVTISGGVATVAFTAQTPGNAGNNDPAIELTFVSPIIGVDSIITVDANGISGGLDEEADDPYRAKILNRKRRPPHGGAEFDYETWMLEVDGNTRAWTFPQYQGDGTIGAAFVRDNDDSILPSPTEIETTRNYIIEHTDPTTGTLVGIPVTAEPGLFMITLTLFTVDLTVKLFPNTSDVQASALARITDLINTLGGPGETLYWSQLDDAISNAVGEDYHFIENKTGDGITASTNQVHVIGTITWKDYENVV
jgi:uncharacterized phage protein gp47/JayE